MAAAPTTIPIPKTIGLLAGPQIIGHSMNMAFFGGLVVQCYLYYIGFPKDRLFNKCLVGGILLLEIVQVCLSTVKMYQNFGTGYGHMPTFGTVGLFWYSSPFATALVSLIVQHFFAWRLWILSGKKWFVPVPVILTSLTQAGAGMSSAVNAHIINKFALLQKANFNRSSVWLGGTALCDCIIAGLMMYYLLSSRTEFKSTNSIITKFVKIAIETGAVCATFATLDLITFFVYQNNNIHVMFAMTLSKLYSNSLLVVLNARIHIQGGRDFTSGQATSAGGNPDISLVMWSERDRETRTNNGINVNISRTVDHDTINSDPKHDTFLHMGDNTTKV